MPVHMVTSRQSDDHVTADDAGHLNALILGSGTYMVTSGWKPALASATDLQLPPFELVWNGRYVRLTQTETVTLGNGVMSGYTRIDLVCLHYTVNDADGVENVDFEVIQGETNGGEPDIPNIVSLLQTPDEAYLPIVKVSYSGLTPTVTAYSSLGSYESSLTALNTSVMDLASQLKTVLPRDVTSLVYDGVNSPEWWHKCSAFKVGSLVLLNVQFNRLESAKTFTLKSGDMREIFRVDESIKPDFWTYVPIISSSGRIDTTSLCIRLNDSTGGVELVALQDTTIYDTRNFYAALVWNTAS